MVIKKHPNHIVCKHIIVITFTASKKNRMSTILFTNNATTIWLGYFFMTMNYMQMLHTGGINV